MAVKWIRVNFMNVIMKLYITSRFYEEYASYNSLIHQITRRNHLDIIIPKNISFNGEIPKIALLKRKITGIIKSLTRRKYTQLICFKYITLQSNIIGSTQNQHAKM